MCLSLQFDSSKGCFTTERLHLDLMAIDRKLCFMNLNNPFFKSHLTKGNKIGDFIMHHVKEPFLLSILKVLLIISLHDPPPAMC